MIYTYNTIGNKAQIGSIFCGSRCRCRNKCDSYFPKGDPRLSMCRNWCGAASPKTKNPPAPSHFKIDDQQYNRAIEVSDSNREVRTNIAETAVNAAVNVAANMLIPGSGGQSRQSGQQSGMQQQQIQQQQIQQQITEPPKDEKTWFEKNKTGVAIAGGITALGAIVGVIIYSNKK